MRGILFLRRTGWRLEKAKCFSELKKGVSKCLTDFQETKIDFVVAQSQSLVWFDLYFIIKKYNVMLLNVPGSNRESAIC